MDVDSIIFDLDGTLWDSSEICARAWGKVASDKELITKQISAEDIRGISGTQHNSVGAILFPCLTQELQTLILSSCYAEEINMIQQFGGTLFPNVSCVLEKLSKRFRLFIVSNCQSGYIEAFLEYHALSRHFSDFECSGNTGMPKSKNIGMVINRNHLLKPVYIGDTHSDSEAAHDNEIPFIYASYGFGHANSAEFRIAQFDDLPMLLS